jgi:prevent-host-death family protein
MKTAAVSELKARLSEFLLCVKAGEEVVVTDRGRPVARITPMGANREEASVRLAALEKAGLARIGSGKIPDGFWEKERVPDNEGNALHALLREREKGR